MKWYHLWIFFKNKKKTIEKLSDFTSEENGEFRCFLNSIVMLLSPYIRRKFFLYEPYPDCFLAFELKNATLVKLLKTRLNQITNLKRPCFIKKIILKKNMKDYNNGESFLNIMDSVTDYILFFGDHPKGFFHIIHCMLNSWTVNQANEYRYHCKCIEEIETGFNFKARGK